LQIQILKSVFRLAVASAVAAALIAAAVVQFSAPAHLVAQIEPAGLAKMQLLRDEHDTMRIFLAAQDARLRAVAAIESEPEPEQPFVMAKAEAERSRALANATPHKPLRVAKLTAPPLSILPPPAPVRMAQLPPPPFAEAPRPRGGYGWVQDASRLPRRLWAAAGELMDNRGPPIPPRPIPPA
jgi:hypothetical protein